MGKGYKGKNPRGGKGKSTEEEAEAEFLAQRRAPAGQNSNAGMLPPSGSEDEDEEAAPSKPAAPRGQPATAGLMPPSDSEGSSDSSDSEPEYLKPTIKKKEPEVQERSAEDIRKEMERLEIIRKKREDDRKRRIDAEGWDRYAPVTATNKPPGHYVPSDHPSRAEE